MPEIIQNQPLSQKPKRRKKNKATHNAVERHRKEKINAGIKRIGDILPCSQALKQSKNMILAQTFRYITELKRQNDEMLLSGGDCVQAEEIKRLRQQVDDLRKESAHYIELLKANDINFLDDPTIHWKGKQRCTKVAKIPPTHLSKGIIVYSNENSVSSTSKGSISSSSIFHVDSQPVNVVAIQPSCNVQIGTCPDPAVPNMRPMNKRTVSSCTTPQVVPVVSKPCVAVMEQYSAVAPIASKFPPPVNYITLQGLCPKLAVTASVLQQTQPTKLTPSPASSTSYTVPPSIQSTVNLTSLPQTLVTSDASVFAQTMQNGSRSQILPVKSSHLRISAASSTQTTWTTLQLTGNTAQPICQSLPTESSNSGINIPQLSLCHVVTNPPVHSSPHVQVQTQTPIQLQTSKQTAIPVRPSPPKLCSAIVRHPIPAVGTQSSLLSQASVVSSPLVLHQSSVVHQTGILPQPQIAGTQPTLLPKPVLSSTQSHSYPAIQPKPQFHNPIPPESELQPVIASQPVVVPQAQSAIVPPLGHSVMPQTNSATLPVLQTMQVLQMNSDRTPVVGTSPSQNNPNVVILQQANPCPAPQVVRDDVTSQTACPHIVIIQTPTMTPSQNQQTSIVPPVVPSINNQNTAPINLCTSPLQANVTKQLVHILPRPATQIQTQAPQTITVNGQVYVLQSIKSSDKGSAQVDNSATQIIQPASGDACTSGSSNSLGALTSLSQSILQVSSQSNGKAHSISSPLSDSNVQPISKPVSGVSAYVEAVVPTDVPVSSTTSATVKILPKKTSIGSMTQSKQMTVKRPRSTKRKETNQNKNTSLSASKTTKSTSELIAQEQISITKDINVSNCSTEISHETITKSTAEVSSVSLISYSDSICVSSHSRSSVSTADESAITTLSNNVEGVQSKDELGSITPQVNNMGNPVSSSEQSLQTNTPAVLSHNVDLQPNESSVEVVTSQSSTLASGVTSCKSVVNNSSSSVTTSQNEIAMNESIVDCRPKELSTSGEAPITLIRDISTKNSVLVSSVDCVLHQPYNVVSGTATPDSTKSGEAAPHTKKDSQLQAMPVKSGGIELVDSHMPTHFNLPATSVTCSESSACASSNSSTQVLSQESRNVNNFSDFSKHSDVGISLPPPSHIASVNIKQTVPNKSKEHVTGPNSENITQSEKFSQETVHSQDVSSLESESFESQLITNRHTDSPMAGTSINRRFSVASLLPTGNITTSPNSFGTFGFTSEQAEILAMAARAIFEQESPGKRGGSCSGESTSMSATGWELPKTQAPILKERIPSQQLKQIKQPDSAVPKLPSQIEVSGSSSSSVRLPLNTSYSQSHTSTVASLNVNNLIRPSSVQTYPGSPSIGQQVSVPSPAGSAILVSQTSSQVTQSCSVPAQVNEYTPLKSAHMRTQSVGIPERHQKGLPKRCSQEELVLPLNKRSKPCPAGNVSRIEAKGTELGQVIAGQMATSSSSVMTRNHSDSGGPLFSGNTFMSTVVRSSEGHCPQLASHEHQSGVLHQQQGHAQHGQNSQSGQNLVGNHYLKHQQQQEQQRHLYQLQHHLTQPDSQIHNIQQRALLQDQNVHKKRVVRGGQTGHPVGLQKQHHLDKASVHQSQQAQQHQQQTQQQQQQQPQQHASHQQQPQQLQQQKQLQQQQTHQQQQQIQQQGPQSRHHLQQQLQQRFGRQEKNCEGQQAGPRAHLSSHLGQQERQPGQDHGTMQRLMSSRTLEQQLTSQANIPVSRSSELACTTSRQERHRLSSYSAEALIGKTSTTGDQRMGHHLQSSRGGSQDQAELQAYVDPTHGKGNITQNPQSRLAPDHSGPSDIQRIPECLPFKNGSQQLNNFEVQVSRTGDLNNKPVVLSQRGHQSQIGFRIGTGPVGEGRSRGSYGTNPSAQGVQPTQGLPRDQDACHQNFMQSLLAPHLTEQTGHQRGTQGCPPVSLEYNCVPGVSSGELQAKVSSPNLHPTQTAPPMHIGDNNKGHISQVGGNLHGSSVRSVLPHPPPPHSSSDTGRAQASSRSLSAVSQRTHHIVQSTKIRLGDRQRSGNLRPVNAFEPENPLSLPSSGGVLLSRSQAGSETRHRSIVRFMSDGAQVSSENNLVSDQHLTQNFGFPFIAEGGINPPPPINANASFITPVTQPSASRTPALLPVEPQNTLPSFYPPYSPAAHPSLPSEIPLQYFPNQMFTSPSADKSSSAPLNNRFGSILSPPRPVGFAQASYPLLTDITPMPIANSSGITSHLSNFNLTSLFPEIATAMPSDGSSMPMSPLLSLSNTSSSDSSKQSNRPAHNISHILGHDGASAV